MINCNDWLQQTRLKVKIKNKNSRHKENESEKIINLDGHRMLNFHGRQSID